MPFRRNANHFANTRGEGMDHECLSLRALPLRKIELTSGNIILLILCVLAFYTILNEVFLFLFLALSSWGSHCLLCIRYWMPMNCLCPGVELLQDFPQVVTRHLRFRTRVCHCYTSTLPYSEELSPPTFGTSKGSKTWNVLTTDEESWNRSLMFDTKRVMTDLFPAWFISSGPSSVSLITQLNHHNS